MPKQVDVLVKDISVDEHGRPTHATGTFTTLSYKSFLIINDPESPRYELIGEVDPNQPVGTDGLPKTVPGNPNLNAQHRQRVTVQSQPSAAPVVNAGPTQKELDQAAEIEKLKAELSKQPSANPVVERKKPGPKPKTLEGATV